MPAKGSTNSGGSFPSLRRLSFGPPTLEERLARLASALDCGDDLSVDERREIASYLKQLLYSPPALRAIKSHGKGRKRNTYDADIALHYAVASHLRGRGRSKQALAHVAEAWSMSESRVKGLYTELRIGAELTLADLLNSVRIGAELTLADLAGLDKDLTARAAARRRPKD